MHDDELFSDESVVHALLMQQFPEWADRSVSRIESTGTSNALYRIGSDLVARLPRRPSNGEYVAREQRWLPTLAPHLPLTVPLPVASGEPSEAFGYPWFVYQWMHGDDAIVGVYDTTQAAIDLAQFINALRLCSIVDAIHQGVAISGRGGPLIERDARTRTEVRKCAGLIDIDLAAVEAVWDRAVLTSPWSNDPVWIHADLSSGNLLVEHRRLSSVIDWGLFGIGDPAWDLIVAWEMFNDHDRKVFREHIDIDDDTWERGRGFALSTAAYALPYYVHTNQFMADQARRKIAALVKTQ
jgi:aminoglycoside phosphotransferase (APT) family kinase protein